MSLLPGSAIESGGYDINNSLRFRSSASAYLSRTPASVGNRKTFTISFWFKRGTLGVDQKFLSSWNADSDNGNMDFRLTSGNILYWGPWSTGMTTTAVFRDPSAWYHVVLTIDTTQATGANRHRVYVNGVEYTFSGSPVTQNTDLSWNNTVAHNIGRNIRTSGDFFDGYMAEFYSIDGQALTPSSFGETDSTTGVWKPKAYSGTYGTNGFYLKFSDIATTSGSNAGLGKDFSGNSNYWTTNNISVTSGTTYDAMTDSPTLTSATVANYAVLSPLDWASASGTLSAGNLNWASSTNVCGNKSTIGATSGKWYWEAIGSSVTSGTIGGRFGFTGSDTIAAEQDKFGMYWHPTSGIARVVNGTNTYVTSAYTYTNSDVLALALDLDSNISYWYKNGVLQYTFDFSSFSTIGSRVFHAYAWNASSGTPSWVYNFGQRPFAYTPRTNHLALNTYNLPDSTIKKGNSYMDAILYTGDGASTKTISGLNFQPDFLWIKRRDNASDHNLQDAVRGFSSSTKLATSSTYAENTLDGLYTDPKWGYVSATSSIGFTVTKSTNGDHVNFNASPYVAWAWDANGSGSTNTAGSITSTVSVNTTAGFSVVTWTGTGSAATVGHGLGVAPKMVISKKRNGTSDWAFWITGFAGTELMELNGTSAKFTGATVWNSTTPTSTVFSVGSATQTNNSGGTYVAYCWAEIAGFSKFGSYVANASSDGPFIYTGFRPRWIMFKRTTSATNWYVIDTSISPYNASTSGLYPNTADVVSSEGAVDILSNGFKCRVSSGAFNYPGNETFAYVAFAENPFKNSLAR
jgi:hypothetical protein